eukprot:GFYU01004695.1.p2 GENE.GFYU01004695.1~~GFYU01004695.1.p2  ORF type:complete len:150 (+),score=39.63 GFYU01004695.1:57-452(+)
MASVTYTCLCKAVAWEATGDPALTCWCHCISCQKYGSDAAQVAGFPPAQVKYTKGEDNLIVYEGAPKKFRKSCKTCGSFVNNVLPDGLFVAPLGGAEFPKGERLKPTMHIFYSMRTREANDDLPKHAEWPQ